MQKAYLISNGNEVIELKDGCTSFGGVSCHVVTSESSEEELACLMYNQKQGLLIVTDHGIGQGTVVNNCTINGRSLRLITGDIIRFLPDHRIFEYQTFSKLKPRNTTNRREEPEHFIIQQNVNEKNLSSSLPMFTDSLVKNGNFFIGHQVKEHSYQREFLRQSHSKHEMNDYDQLALSSVSSCDTAKAIPCKASSEFGDACEAMDRSHLWFNGKKQNGMPSPVIISSNLTASNSNKSNSLKNRYVLKRLSSSDMLLPNLSKSPDESRRNAWKPVKNTITRTKSSDCLHIQSNVSSSSPLPALGWTDSSRKLAKRVNESNRSTSLVREDSFCNMLFSDKDSSRDDCLNPLFPSPAISSGVLNVVQNSSAMEEPASFEVKLSEKLKDLQKTVSDKQSELKNLKKAIATINSDPTTVKQDLAEEVERLRQDKKLITGLVREAHKEMARKDNSMKVIMKENKLLRSQLTSFEIDQRKSDVRSVQMDSDKKLFKGHTGAGKKQPTEVIETPIVKEKVKLEPLLSRSSKALEELESNDGSSLKSLKKENSFVQSTDKCNVWNEIKSIGTQAMSDETNRERLTLLHAEQELTSWKMTLRDLSRVVEVNEKEKTYLKLDLESVETRCTALDSMLEETKEHLKEAIAELEEYKEAESKIMEILSRYPEYVKQMHATDEDNKLSTMELLQNVFENMNRDVVNLKEKVEDKDKHCTVEQESQKTLIDTINEIERNLNNGGRQARNLEEQTHVLKSLSLDGSATWVSTIITSIYWNSITWQANLERSLQNFFPDSKSLCDQNTVEFLNEISKKKSDVVDAGVQTSLQKECMQTQTSLLTECTQMQTEPSIVTSLKNFDQLRNDLHHLKEMQANMKTDVTSSYGNFMDELKSSVSEIATRSGIVDKSHCEVLALSQGESKCKDEEIHKQKKIKLELEKAYRETCAEMKRLRSETNKLKFSFEASENKLKVLSEKYDDQTRTLQSKEEALKIMIQKNQDYVNRSNDETNAELRDQILQKCNVINKRTNQLKKLRNEIAKLVAERDVDHTIISKLKTDLKYSTSSTQSSPRHVPSSLLSEFSEPERLSVVGTCCVEQQHITSLKKLTTLLDSIYQKIKNIQMFGLEVAHEINDKKVQDILKEICKNIEEKHLQSGLNFKQVTNGIQQNVSIVERNVNGSVKDIGTRNQQKKSPKRSKTTSPCCHSRSMAQDSSFRKAKANPDVSNARIRVLEQELHEKQIQIAKSKEKLTRLEKSDLHGSLSPKK